jgi:hypothetical protein
MSTPRIDSAITAPRPVVRDRRRRRHRDVVEITIRLFLGLAALALALQTARFILRHYFSGSPL